MSFTLVILAAGLGSRYGGLKQLQPIGPNNEILMDYSIYDAIQAGCDNVICIIRKDIEEDFSNLVSKKWKNKIAIQHVFQELDSFVPQDSIHQNRKKPWGTAHAILCCEQVITSPFIVINADDFYGKSTYQVMANFLHNNASEQTKLAMVAFELGNTLSRHGTVSRGICIENGNNLKSIEECENIHKKDNSIVSNGKTLTSTSSVSMNFWGFTPFIFPHLKHCFKTFLNNNNNEKKEFYIPAIVDSLIQNSLANVEILHSKEKWIGITNPDDLQIAKQEINKLLSKNYYPNQIF